MSQAVSKKLVITGFAILAAIIIGLVTTLLVLASINQNVQSDINVSYTASGIYGQATATYKVGETGTETPLTNSNGNKIVFNGEIEGDKTLTPNDINLNSENYFVVFKYTFTNKRDKVYYAEMTYDDTGVEDKNIKTTYSIDGTTYIETKSILNVPAATDTADGVADFYIKVAVENKAKDATFTGDIKWNLTSESPVLNYNIKQDLDYTESVAKINNPDQGFYFPVFIRIGPNGKVSSNTSLIDWNTVEHQLFQLKIDISDFSGKVNGSGDLELTEAALNFLEEELNIYKSHKKNLIVRFSYHPSYDGAFPGEPAWNVLLTHVAQVCSVLNNFESTITAVEAGMIGSWGEMTSNSSYMTTTHYNELIEKFLSETTNLKILVRKPSMIFNYMGITGADIAANKQVVFNSKTERLGFYNDAIMANWIDLGTYEAIEGVNDRRADVIKFLMQFTYNTPMGGEMIYNSGNPALQHIDGCLPEMRNLHLSYLDINYDTIVIDKWRNEQVYNNEDDPNDVYNNQTAFTYIQNHLGYRYVLKESTFNYTNKYDSLNISLKIDNVGFGNLTKNKKAKLSFVDESNNVVATQEITDYNGEAEYTASVNMNLANGNYKVYITLYGDETADGTIYNLRFANSNALWSETLNANLIGNITINK